jgi:hypothetical protein
MIANDDSLDDGSGAVVEEASATATAPAPFAVLPTTTRPIVRRITILWTSPHDPPEKCVLSWKDHHPESEGWDVRLMTNRDGWLHQDLMDALWKHVHEADWPVMEIARLNVLSSLGGFVVAADSYCDRSLASGTIQAPDKPQTDFFGAADCLLSYSDEKAGTIGSHFVAGVRSSEFSNRCIEALDKYCRENVWSDRAGAIELSRYVGSKLLSEVASVMLREPATRAESKLKILPARMFSPVDAKGNTSNGAVCPIYARAQHGKERGINHLRKWPCQCQTCRNTFSSLRPPWG